MREGEKMPLGTPLGDQLSIVHLASGIAGAYCTKLLVDGGAKAIRVEPPEGDPLRWRSASGAPVNPDLGGSLFQYLAASTASVTADVRSSQDRTRAWGLLESADVVVWSEGSPLAEAPEFSPVNIRSRAPGAVVVALTPYGLWAAEQKKPATEFTLQAMSGGWITRGSAAREPLAAGGDHGDWVLGTFAALGALAGWTRARRSGRGELVDVAMLDALHLTQPFFAPTFEVAAGRPYRSFRARPLPLNHPTKDGYVGFQVTTGQQWLDFCLLVERPDWAQDPSLARQEVRTLRYDEVCGHIDKWTSERTTEEVVEIASLLRLPVAPVNNGETIRAFPPIVARGWIIQNPHGGFQQPVPPYTFWGDVALRPPGPSPRLGEHNGAARPGTAQSDVRAESGESGSLPFERLRIIDFTAFWAGPIISHFFAILGADVIHVESTTRPDGLRASTLRHDMSEGWWEASPFFAGTNTNKRGITLDMNTERGRELALKLIADADILVENFSSRVMEQWGLTYDRLQEINPRLIMLRASGFGNSGPWRDHVAYATTVEQASGLSWVTGYPDDRPEITGGACDPIAGSHAAFAIMLALQHRDRTGQGILVEAPQFTSGLSISAEQMIERSATGAVLGRNGNRSWVHAPQGAYRVADAAPRYASTPTDDWIALSVTSQAQWRALCEVIDAPRLALDPELADAQGRMRRHDEIDEAIGAWARPLPAVAAVEALTAAGVPASRFIGLAGLHELPEVVSRGLYEYVDQPVLGRVPIVGYPARFEHGPHRIHRTPAPTLGQHNREILEQVLGLSRAEVEVLEAAEIIGQRPRTGTAW